jgi:hypothetical protein
MRGGKCQRWNREGAEGCLQKDTEGWTTTLQIKWYVIFSEVLNEDTGIGLLAWEGSRTPLIARNKS